MLPEVHILTAGRNDSEQPSQRGQSCLKTEESRISKMYLSKIAKNLIKSTCMKM